jgi:hypothetical protein
MYLHSERQPSGSSANGQIWSARRVKSLFMKEKLSQNWGMMGMYYMATAAPWPNANEKTFSQCEGVFHPNAG